MSNWLEEEKERKKIMELEAEKERIRKDRLATQNATQIEQFKSKISPFYSYVDEVKNEGFSINILEYSSGIIEINNGNYRGIKINPTSHNSFYLSIIGTFNNSITTYDSPIVEEISLSYEDYSFTRETRLKKSEFYSSQREICVTECAEHQLAQFLNNKENALKLIGWIFDKTKLHTRWLPGIIPAEVEYRKSIEKSKEEYNSQRLKKIGKALIKYGAMGLIVGIIVFYLFNSERAMLWIIFIFCLFGIWVSDPGEAFGDQYHLNQKKFDFEF